MYVRIKSGIDMQYFLYAIGNEENLIYPYDNCYIGVTNVLERRWKEHTKRNSIVGNYIRQYNLQFEKNMIVIQMGSDIECFAKEYQLRPFPMMGLNESAGGNGGYTSYSEKRNKTISEKLKNRKITWSNKVSNTRIQKCIAKGDKNPRAKSWELTSPDGNVIICKGNLQEICNENNLLVSCLKRYIGSVVPDIASNGYGGYRAKNDISRERRINSIGWKLNPHNGG